MFDRLLLLVTIFVSLTVHAQPSQQPLTASGTGVIGGMLTRSGTADPVRKASVVLASINPEVARIATTDQDGRFVFEQLPAADYTLTASKPGFLDGAYGSRRVAGGPPGTAIKLGAGQKLDSMSFSLAPASTVSGTIRDEFGDSVYQMPVRALRFGYDNGERTLAPAGSATTDDRGQYRIAGLSPGEYLVSAVPRDTPEMTAERERARALSALMEIRERAGGDLSRAEIEKFTSAPLLLKSGYVPVYFPGVIQPSVSSSIRVGVAEDVSGIDLRLQVAQTVTITGTVTSEEPMPAAVTVRLIDPAMPLANLGTGWLQKTDATGRFTFTGILPGAYVLQANARMPPTAAGGAGELTQAQRIDVAIGSASDYTLRIARGVNVAGQIDVGSLRGSVDVSKLRVTVWAVSGWQLLIPNWREAPDAAGSFMIRGVPPGRFRIGVEGLPAGWTLASAIFGGRDASDLNLIVEPGNAYAGRLTFTDRAAELTGIVATASGTPSAQHTVIIFPSDQSMWVPSSRRIQALQTGADGRYRTRGMPPGDYRVIAVVDPEPGGWFNAAYLTTLVPLSMPITVGEGERKVQDLRVR